MAIRGALGPMVVAALLAVPVVAGAECKTEPDLPCDYGGG